MTLNYIAVFLLLGIALIGVTTYLQFRYASANYPRSLRWLLLRTTMAFLSGATVGIAIFSQDFHGMARITAIVVNGVFFVVLFGFGLEYKLRDLVPKRKTSGTENGKTRVS